MQLPGHRQLAILHGEEQPGAVSRVVSILSGLNGCSGLLLTPDWILSAAHCFAPEDLARPERTTVIRGNIKPGVPLPIQEVGLQWTIADRIVPHPAAAQDIDVALVHVGRPAFSLALHSADRAALFAGSAYDLYGKQLSCYGSGIDESGGGDETLQVARSMSVVSGDDRFLDLRASPSGANPSDGDSGGPCLLETPDQVALAGVISARHGSPR